MIAGVDTGFFFALEENDPTALRVWREEDIVTSVIVLYELQKKLLQGHFRKWPAILADIRAALSAVTITEEISLNAGQLAHKYGLPGLDALILSSLLAADVKHIYTTDAHFELYDAKGITITNLST